MLCREAGKLDDFTKMMQDRITDITDQVKVPEEITA